MLRKKMQFHDEEFFIELYSSGKISISIETENGNISRDVKEETDVMPAIREIKNQIELFHHIEGKMKQTLSGENNQVFIHFTDDNKLFATKNGYDSHFAVAVYEDGEIYIRLDEIKSDIKDFVEKNLIERN